MATKVKHKATVPAGSPAGIPPEVAAMLAEDDRRRAEIHAKFNPITGEGSIGDRVKLELSDFPLKVQWIPRRMLSVPLVRQLKEAGSIRKFYKSLGVDIPYSDDEKQKIIEQFTRIRYRHDFPFWAASLVYIKPKGEGGEDILFRLNRAQRKLVSRFEAKRLKGKPIRLILVKTRQWGGSTVTQIYMSWLQLIHKEGLNSLIVGHLKDTSTEVKDMFDRMINEYPVELLYEMGEAYNENEAKLVGVGKTGNIFRCPQRNFKIKLGSAEKPNSARGGDYNLVHCTEVGLWQETKGKKPEDIVRSACSGVRRIPYTMIVYESTANGTGNFFHREYLAAKAGTSQFESLFVSWFEIEWNILPFVSEKERIDFALWLYNNRNNETVSSSREEPGRYLWYLWTLGATLEGINWYVAERSDKNDHAEMASECPSDDEEAFTFSGRHVFNKEDIKQFRPACRPPKIIGEIYGRGEEGEDALKKIRIRKEENGKFWVWQDVEKDGDDEEVRDRYLVVVDVCKGHTERADYSVICVFDRLNMIDGDKPVIVAQWYGHIDMDLLAWKAAQVAAYYNNALLVIESNTLETNNTKGDAEYILNLVRDVYGDMLYARKQSAEDIREKVPLKYGFHTNVATKPVIINNLKTMVREHLYIERDSRCLDEYETYIENEKGVLEAMEGHHDDLLMTRAIGLYICFHEMPLPTIRPKQTRRTRSRRAVSAATI